MRPVASFFPLLLFSAALLAQSTAPDIHRYVSMIEEGKAAEVKAEVPSLLSRYPNDPGVLYLQGLTTVDGAEAVRIFQSIVDNFPKSEWADDALYRVYQFYYALGLYRTAELKLEQLKHDYPDSRYLREPGKPDVKALAEEPASPPAPSLQAPSSSGLVYDSGRAAVQSGEVAESRAVPPKQSLAPSGPFALQVGAYTAQANADRQKAFFERNGYSVDVISKVKDNRTLILVIVGSFPSYDAAKAESSEFKRKYGIDCIVVTR